MSHHTPRADAHAEYSSTALSFVMNGAVQLRRGIIVQCPTVDHEHTDKLTVSAKTVQDPEVGLAWMVTAHGPEGIAAMEVAYRMAQALAPILPGAPQEG